MAASAALRIPTLIAFLLGAWGRDGIVRYDLAEVEVERREVGWDDPATGERRWRLLDYSVEVERTSASEGYLLRLSAATGAAETSEGELPGRVA